MQATADSLAFAPPPEPAAVRGFILAVIAHILLIVALTWGINWDKDTTPAAVEAELWSALPQEAAPPPAPEPPQVVQAPPIVQAPPPPVEKAPDINIERDKKRKQEEARRQQEEEHRKVEAQKKKLEEQHRLAEEKKLREELAKKEKAKQELEAKKREQVRKDQIARMQALAAGGGSPSAQGNAQRSSGPSADYASRIAALIRKNTTFTEAVPGDPSVEVEVRLAPDGTIVGAPKVVKSSGNAARDEAVLRGIIKTERLPRDRDGRIFSPMIISVKQFS